MWGSYGFENIKEAVAAIKGEKVRYCETPLQRLMPCDVGWGSYGSEGLRNCFDESRDENCRNIVEVRDLQCPYCGSHLAMK